MTSSQDSNAGRPGQGFESFINQAPLLMTIVAGTALASPLYVASALFFKAGVPDYGFGFALRGLAVNAMPSSIVWAAMKWTR